MRTISIILVLALTMVLGGCGGASGAQKRAFRAQEAVAKERLRLVEKYQSCVSRAGDDPVAKRGCETYLSSAEALQ